MRLDHINIFVSSIERSKAFYSEVFNLSLKEKGVSAKSGREFQVIGNPQGFYLCLHQAPKNYDLSGGRVNHFGVHVDDFEGFVKRMEDSGVEILYGGIVHWPKSRSLYIQGPDAEEIEVSEHFGGKLD